MALCTYGYLDPQSRAALLGPAPSAQETERPDFLLDRFADLLPLIFG